MSVGLLRVLRGIKVILPADSRLERFHAAVCLRHKSIGDAALSRRESAGDVLGMLMLACAAVKPCLTLLGATKLHCK